MTPKRMKERKYWRPDFEYEVDYNDHFESPEDAYRDILPLLDSLKVVPNENVKHHRKDHIIYDPYYCTGRTKRILRTLGFENVIHEKRDFYKDIEDSNIPNHHTLITNPPYSDEHKERCLQFCLKQFLERGRPFFLLMPDYVAKKNYYRKIIGDAIEDVAYFVPSRNYLFQHPEGTGYEKSPFSSLWFCGIGKERIQQLKGYLNAQTISSNKPSQGQRPKFVESFEKLVSLGVISLQNRPNPRKRKKMRKSIQAIGREASMTKKIPRGTKVPAKAINNDPEVGIQGGKRRNSKYRNSRGKRTKKRF